MAFVTALPLQGKSRAHAACVRKRQRRAASLSAGGAAAGRELYTDAALRTDASGFVDFVAPGGAPRARARAPSVRLFESPAVAWLYERGWRAGFARAGFPGADAEVEAAARHLGGGEGVRVVLDASCGSGLLTRRLAAHYARVVSLDYSAAMLREAASRSAGEWVRADVGAMPFVDGAFDGVVAGAALHCWPAVPDALREVRRVLRPGGAFYATTFARDTLVPRFVAESGLAPPARSSRFFWPDELRWLCKAAGFAEVDVQAKKSFITVLCRK